MKKIIIKIYQFIFFLNLFEFFLMTSSSEAFIPTLNEPNQKELKSSSIQIGKTAIQLMRFGKDEEAIKLFKLAVTLNPKEISLWVNLAEAQIRLNRKYQALLSINKAIKIKPNEQNLYFTKGAIYMDLDDPKKAKILIKKGLSIDKDNERGYFQLGNSEIMLKNYKSALIAFKKSSNINSNFWQSINNEGLILYELNNSLEAIEKFRLALKISNDPEPMLALAIALFSIDNKSNESINLAKNALTTNPNYVSKKYQETQLWGEKLQRSGQLLFKAKKLKKVVREAKEKSQ